MGCGRRALHILWALMCFSSAQAQDFAPVGAKWHYGAGAAFSPNTFYMWVESVGDSVVHGRTCQKLISNYGLDCSFYSSPAFVYHEDSAVYFYEPHLDTFQTLYDFKLSPGESWKTVFFAGFGMDSVVATVDSVDFEEINGRVLKQLYVTYEIVSGENWGGIHMQYNAVISERLGDMEYLFRLFSAHAICDGTFSRGLRCYEDSEIGFYSTGIAPTCDYQWVSVDDGHNVGVQDVHPNPTSGIVRLSIPATHDVKCLVMDLTGRQVMGFSVKRDDVIVDLSKLPDGMYMLRTEQAGHTLGMKTIVKRGI